MGRDEREEARGQGRGEEGEVDEQGEEKWEAGKGEEVAGQEGSAVKNSLVRKAQIPSPLQKPSHRLCHLSTEHHGALCSKVGFVGVSHSQTITVGISKAELKTF